MAVPAVRIRTIHDRPPRPEARYVLYWMIAARRTSWNFALDRAVQWARDLEQPLVVLEALECDYPWASDRLHRFVIDGMRDNAASFARSGVTYYPYVEPEPGAGRGLLATLASDASVVVTDDSPVFFLPSIVRAASRHIETRFEAVDGCGILPMQCTGARSGVSVSVCVSTLPAARVAATPRCPNRVGRRFVQDRCRRSRRLRRKSRTAGRLRIRRSCRARATSERCRSTTRVCPVAIAGGSTAARARLDEFLATRLDRYGEGRNHPDEDVSSRLSPYLHFGHISAHEIVHGALACVDWTPKALSTTARGTREGWWGVTAPVEAFLDQVITWRELGFNMSARRRDVASFDALPSWAIVTLEKHAHDRPGTRLHARRIRGGRDPRRGVERGPAATHP